MSTIHTAEVVNIRGIPVTFPFVPYKCQIDYMECVITSLQESQNAMLESPTGTGKTLCLLASTLAWRQEKVKQLEAAHVALAEEAALYIEGGLTAENMEKQAIPKPRAPTIIYATRTHSQISQVVSEFHRTSYASSVSMSVLGSRSQLCIHPVVSQTRGGVGALNRACNAHVQRSSCLFHTNVELYKQNLPRTRDIEDLVMWGRRHSACPYFIAKDQQAASDLLFIPYNYIIDPLIRRSLNIDLKGSIVVLDEAHNLEQVASDTASFDLSSNDLKLCLTQIQQCLDAFGGTLPEMPTEYGSTTHSRKQNSASKDDAEPPLSEPSRAHPLMEASDETSTSTAHATLLKEAITALLSEFTTTPFSGGTNVKVSDGKWIFELFERIGINAETAPAYLRTVDQVALLLQEGSSLQLQIQQTSPSVSSQNAWNAANALSSFSEALRKMFMTGVPISEASSHFKAVLQRDTSSRAGPFQSKATKSPQPIVNGSTSTSTNTAPNQEKRSGPFDRQWTYKLSLWCFYPGLAMQSLMSTGIRSLIVTSGTLSPIDSFAYELSIPFPIRLENPHVIPTSQIWVGVLPTAVNGETLNSAYSNRSELYTESLGHTLTAVARISPGGLLVFFPSYKMMEDCIDMWKSGDINSNIWSHLCRYKRPVVEPRESSKLKSIMKEFYDKVDQPSEGDITGAVFFAVCRGKVSEGLDFSNNYGRTVIVTGLPFAQTMDQKVKLKREYLDGQCARKLLKSSSPALESPVVPHLPAIYEPIFNLPADKPLSGNEWYAQSAWRAVNQAIGRVIRHRDDYGAILFLDERFVGSASTHLSKWLRPHVHTLRTPGPLFQAVARFFHSNASHFAAQAAIAESAALASSSAPSMPVDLTRNRVALISHVSATNSKRRSVFETRSEATSSTSSTTSHTHEEPDKRDNMPKSNKDTEKEKTQKAANLLSMARTQLTPDAFQSFQTAMKKFKTRQMKRSDLLISLSTLLAAYPAFLAALDEYLSQGRSTAPHTSPNLETSASKAQAPVIVLPSVSNSSKRQSSISPLLPSSMVSVSPDVTQTALKRGATSALPLSNGYQGDGMEISPQQPNTNPINAIEIDPPSLEIIAAPSSKKRERLYNPSDEFEPQTKRILSPPKQTSTASSIQPPMQRRSVYGSVVPPSVVPDDSILDLSTHSPQASQNESIPSNPAMRPIVVHSIASPSIELLSSPFPGHTQPAEVIQQPLETTEWETLKNVPLPSSPVRMSSDSINAFPMVLNRKSSSDLAPKVASGWLKQLSRGNSAGISPSVPPMPPTSPPTATGRILTTPKKVVVDLLTGQMVPRGVPKLRTSPPKPSSETVLIPDSVSSPQVDQPLSTGDFSDELVPMTECPICAQTTMNFQSAPCGHRCCANCWERWLKSKMECPFCRGRVRAKKLKNDD